MAFILFSNLSFPFKQLSISLNMCIYYFNGCHFAILRFHCMKYHNLTNFQFSYYIFLCTCSSISQNKLLEEFALQRLISCIIFQLFFAYISRYMLILFSLFYANGVILQTLFYILLFPLNIMLQINPYLGQRVCNFVCLVCFVSPYLRTFFPSFLSESRREGGGKRKREREEHLCERDTRTA